MRLTSADIEALERATLAAVSPEAIEELDGWLLGFDSGVVQRAKSAVPLRHEGNDPAAIDAIAAHYTVRRMRPLFRIADRVGLANVQARLRALGFAGRSETLVQVGAIADAIGAASPEGVQLAERPDAAWIAAFLGEGFDPVDGASRAKTLARGADTIFASIREGDVAIGAGAMSFGFGWASIHGMRTAQARRGERIGARIIAALAKVAAERSFGRVFLQVDENNPPALALYRRAGFTTAWRYAYWDRQADG